MPRYKVSIPEIHYWTVIVEAEDEQEAYEKAGDMDHHQEDFGSQWSHTIWEDVEIEELEEEKRPPPKVGSLFDADETSNSDAD